MNCRRILITAVSILTCLTGLPRPTTAAAAGSSVRSNAGSAAGPEEAAGPSGAGRLSVVCTSFPGYDFARQILGDSGDVTMLLRPGAESHTYEPTPQDILTIQKCDLFVYTGGDSDEWVRDVLLSVQPSSIKVFRMMDCVKLAEEPHSEGMEEDWEEEDEGSPEMDEHVWTSPANAMEIIRSMESAIVSLDPDRKEFYASQAEAYLSQIVSLDRQFREIVRNAACTEIIVADRFPFRYFCDEYGLTYYAAFPGCSTDTQPSAKTVAFLIDQVKKDRIPMIFHIELSSSGEQMCRSIAEATGARVGLLHAVHNVSLRDFEQGATYVSLMQHNAAVLKEALQ